MIGRTNSGGAGDPSIPVGTGQHLVTFYDFDGKVLKRQRVATGGNATAPTTPTHEFLTFAEWNNPFTNVQSDIDTGAIYNTTDGKTYLFITLTQVTGLAPTLYFSKSSTSLMTIDWGDGTTSTSTTSGNQSINHVYATAGDYIITVDNSAGGTWTAGQGGYDTSLFGSNKFILTKLYLGNYVILNAWAFYNHSSLKYASFGTNMNYNYSGYFIGVKTLKYFAHKGNTVPQFYIAGNQVMNKLYFNNTITSIGQQAFINTNIISYTFTSVIPPTLANANAFGAINPICKIYVPDASVEAYKAATNWITLANYIYPLSSKPQSDE